MSIEDQEYSTKTRIINVLLAYPEDYERNARLVAELADSSDSYVYTIFNQVDEWDISPEEMEEERVEELQELYQDQIDELIDEYGIDRKEEEAATAKPGEETSEEEAQLETGRVPIEEVVKIRSVMERYREEAKFEREHFEGSAVNSAHVKYRVSDRAIELLDQLESEGEVDISE